MTRASSLARLTNEEKTVGKSESILNIVFVSKAVIREINRDFLGSDRVTDVIAFDLRQPSEFVSRESSSFDFSRGAGEEYEDEKPVSAEIYICPAIAYDFARKHGKSAESELVLYIVHGMLHIAGFSDLTTEDKTIMGRREEEIINELSAEFSFPEIISLI